MVDAERMNRRTFKSLRADRAEHHHNVYVVLLAPAAGRLAAVRAANPTRLESLSVGMRTIHSVRSPAA